MLIIGHRGAAGLAPENSLESLRLAFDAGADILEFDVRLTKDNVPVIIHDKTTARTHKTNQTIAKTTYKELKKHTKDLHIPTLDEVLDEFFGKVILNIEIKARGSAKTVLKTLKPRIKRKSDWDHIIISSFHSGELVAARKASEHVNLGLLHSQNPFIFIAYHRRLDLTAVGFHRLYINTFALDIAKRAGIFTYAYTINRTATAFNFAQKGIDGIVTDRPDTILSALHPHKKGRRVTKKSKQKSQD